MAKSHGFSIPELGHLQVDLETMLAYLDLIISDYFQCLQCNSVRSSEEAARQHMMAKGHCNLVITDPDSEFRDFYDFESISAGEVGKAQSPTAAATTTQGLVQVDGTSIRLRSGKVVSDRSVHIQRPRRRHSPGVTTTPPEPNNRSLGPEDVAQGDPSAQSLGPLRASRKRNLVLGNQISRMRAADRTSLLHLSPSEQRSQLAVQKKQVDEARRAQRQMESRVQGMGNKTLMKHFVIDVPGRANG